MSEERTVCARSEGNEVRAVCEYDRGRGLEGDEGAGRPRGVYAELLAAFLFSVGIRAQATKKMTKANRGS
jgi:hypothetical protein